MPKTGNGASVVFTTSGFTGSFTKMGEWQQTKGKLATDHLATTGFKTFIPDDLADPGEVEFELYFDARVAIPAFADAETVTITFPKEASTSTAAATLAGTAFIIASGTPELVNGTISKQKLKIAWNGGTGPAFTKEVVAA